MAATNTTKSNTQQQARPKKALVTPAQVAAIARAEARRVTANKQVTGFLDFLREQSVVGLAIGLVIGTQVKQLVDQIVLQFINPFLGLVLPGAGTLEEKTFTLHLGDKMATFGWGAVANTLLSFIIVAALVYAAFKMLHLENLAKKKEEPKKEDQKEKKEDKKTKK